MREFLSSLSFFFFFFDVLEFQPKRIILSGSKCVRVESQVAFRPQSVGPHPAKLGKFYFLVKLFKIFSILLGTFPLNAFRISSIAYSSTLSETSFKFSSMFSIAITSSPYLISSFVSEITFFTYKSF